MTKVVVDPLTRIEGHLRVSTEVDDNGVITDAQSSGMLFRGIERIMMNRDPRDAARLVQRICGLCPTAQSMASVNALDDLFGVAESIPKDALVTRNIIQGLNTLTSHATHFYVLWMPDIVNPAYRDILATVDNTGPALWKELLSRFAPISYKMDGEAITPGTGYINAIKQKKNLEEAMALIGGKMPHQMSTIAGGVTYLPTVADIGKLTSYYLNLMDFVNTSTLSVDAETWLDNTFRASSPQKAVNFVMEHLQEVVDGSLASQNFSKAKGWGDLELFAAFGSELIGETLGLPATFKFDRTGQYAEDANVGYLTYGVFYDVENGDGYNPTEFGKSGFQQAAFINSSLEKKSFNHEYITEETTHAFYETDEGLHPFDGVTEPVRTADEISYEGGSDSKYTWMKAPRYNGIPCEVGPISRMLAMEEPLTVGLMNLFKDNGYSAANSFTRMIAKMQETLILSEQLLKWVTVDLDPNGKYYVNTDLKMAKDSEGIGLWEAPRGALGHWIKSGSDSMVTNFQMVVPTTWNASPRDKNGVAGPLEQALIGTKISAAENMMGIDNTNPTGILHTARSFDPCIACAVHTIDLSNKGKEQGTFTIV
ncbi:nickel-dependent hydrogenase large subunit [Methanolobus sp. WCC1]|uniref:nickel-dependent hydrogenase large subunit n=1 Tax=unclassified Methanolobus TaxID=2629569 RepID=UPI00324E5A30